MADLLPLNVTRKLGSEAFQDGTKSLDFNLLCFWQWSASDLVSNALRGRLAEFLVAQALGIALEGLRSEWDAYDLCTPQGVTIEVKSSAYLQTWSQKGLSAINFDIAPTRRWDPNTNIYEKESRRQADLYVFALLAHQDKSTLNVMDVSQWEFYLLPTSVLNNRVPNQRQLSLSALKRLEPTFCRFPDLSSCIESLTPSATSSLQSELATFKRLLPTLLIHSGKYAVIAGDDVLSIRCNYEEAIEDGYKSCGLTRRFLVRLIEASPTAKLISRFIKPINR